jgi:hypothetical protein
MSENTATPAPAPIPAAEKPKAGPGKKLFRAAVALVIVLVLVALLVFLNLNSLVRAGVIRGGHYATDQNTDLKTADLSLSQHTLVLDSLDIANPAGYSAPKLLTMKNCSVSGVEPGSIFSDTVVIDEIAIQGLEITLEQNGAKNNLSEIIDIIQKKTAAAQTGAATTPDAGKTPPGKKLRINKLNLAGTKVHVRANLGAPFALDLDLPALSITDPTNPDGRPMKIADLVGTVLLHLSKQIVENPQIPGNIKDSMKNVEALVNNLRGELDKNVKVFTQGLQDAARNLDPKALQDAGKGLQDAGKNIGNLLNQNKNQK